LVYTGPWQNHNHRPSIERAKEQLRIEGQKGKVRGRIGNVEFSAISSNDESIGNDYDLITFFDCLHDMGDPVGQ
jgi:hypothetical protein